MELKLCVFQLTHINTQRGTWAEHGVACEDLLPRICYVIVTSAREPPTPPLPSAGWSPGFQPWGIGRFV